MKSLWNATISAGTPARAALGVHTKCDVAIVGGGYTGLWTARSLAEADPRLSIVVLEAEHCGFGASSRNGGWCSALFPTAHTSLADRHGRVAAATMRDAMRDAVDEVRRATEADGIDCHYAKGGTITMVTNPAHLERVRAATTDPESGETWLTASDAIAHVNAAGLLGASYTPHCAVLHPARLAFGLANAVEQRGVRIFENTRVERIAPGFVACANGSTVRADAVLRCTEGFTSALRGHRRDLVPIYSLMIATEPLPDSVWADIGLADRASFTDGRHMIIYGQRTADGRIAFGGRGAPYHFGSRVRPEFDQVDGVFDALEHTLRQLFPQMGSATITHRWGGPLGVSRDWMASVGFDEASGLGWAGGYVGDGVATTNLAGRTLAALVTGDRSDTSTALTDLPWVQHRSPRWEPEPFRWIGINAGRAVAGLADNYEDRTQRAATAAESAMAWFTGD